MNDSILTSIKKLLGITEDYTSFDVDIIMHINSVFAMITQICPLLPSGFEITGKDETWADYLSDAEETASLNFVKTYIYQKVRMAFDPPTGGVLDALKDSINELEWRLSVSDNV